MKYLKLSYILYVFRVGAFKRNNSTYNLMHTYYEHIWVDIEPEKTICEIFSKIFAHNF